MTVERNSGRTSTFTVVTSVSSLRVATTPDEATRVMAQYVDPARLTTLVVGDLDVIGRDFTSLNLGEAVVLSADTF